MPAVSAPATLDILVENSGRVNFTKVIRTERKGITGSVTLAGRETQHWQIYSLPHDQIFGAALHCRAPAKARVSTDSAMRVSARSVQTSDTFLDMHNVSKGIAFLNAQPLGRFWSVGPQFTLYTPGPWLRAGANSIILFDLKGTGAEALTTIDHADYGPPNSARMLLQIGVGRHCTIPELAGDEADQRQCDKILDHGCGQVSIEERSEPRPKCRAALSADNRASNSEQRPQRRSTCTDADNSPGECSAEYACSERRRMLSAGSHWQLVGHNLSQCESNQNPI